LRITGRTPVAQSDRGRKFLDRLTVDYLKSQLESGRSDRTKKALQQICKLYRDGFRVPPAELIGIEQSIVGLLYTQTRDEKVRRWALNALARLGREPTCMEAIKHTLERYPDEPQTSAAAIAAIFRLSRKAAEILKKLAFDEQMVALAALQHVDANKLDLSALPVNVETASADLLKLALIVVGLDRAPDNMLHPRHSNPQIVRALGGHNDSIVSQYSVWAITENAGLGLGDLGIDIRNIEQQPSNVRGWLFRLVGMNASADEPYIEYIQLGMEDDVVEARTGLAIGLKDTYFDGLEPLVLDWVTSEPDQDVNEHLIEHMIKNVGQNQNYEAMVLEIYERAPPNSSLRRRMEVCASGTALYGKLMRVSMVGTGDLFRGATINMNKNTYNISGGIQGGAVAVGGNAENQGSVQIHYNPQTIEALQSELSKAERELELLSLDPDLKKQALEHVREAKASPTPEKLRKVVSVLDQVNSGIIKAADTIGALGTLGAAIGKLAGLW
jgi:hypothetical protein